MMGDSIFITGATGFIGANLTKRLVLDGYNLVILIRKDSSHPFLDGLKIRRVIGDITDKASVKKGLEGCSYVFHCAAKISFNRYDYELLYRTNVEGTKNMLEAAYESGIEMFVHISSCAVLGYSSNKTQIIDEGSTYKVPKDSVYAYTKKLAEEEVKRFCQMGLRATITNPCTVYGQGDKTLNSGFLIKSIYHNSLKVAPPGGTSFISVNDVIEGLILLIEKGRNGERYIFAAENLEYIDLFNKIAEVLKVKKVKYKLPNFLYYPAVSSAKGLEMLFNIFNKRPTLLTSQIIKETFGYKYFSSKKARQELGWQPRVEIGDAVKKAFEFYQKEGLI